MGARNHNQCVHFAPYIYPTELKLFKLFFRYFIEGVLQNNINARKEGEKVSYGKFLLFIGVWLIMTTTQGPVWRNFWLKKNPLKGAPLRVSDYKTRNQFEAMLYYFNFTNEEAKQYKGTFHEVRQMLHMQNNNIYHYFNSECITCLDKSM